MFIIKKLCISLRTNKNTRKKVIASRVLLQEKNQYLGDVLFFFTLKKSFTLPLLK
jgi:hypothetical protein